jgi:hypothetical protein
VELSQKEPSVVTVKVVDRLVGPVVSRPVAVEFEPTLRYSPDFVIVVVFVVYFAVDELLVELKLFYHLAHRLL